MWLSVLCTNKKICFWFSRKLSRKVEDKINKHKCTWAESLDLEKYIRKIISFIIFLIISHCNKVFFFLWACDGCAPEIQFFVSFRLEVTIIIDLQESNLFYLISYSRISCIVYTHVLHETRFLLIYLWVI